MEHPLSDAKQDKPGNKPSAFDYGRLREIATLAGINLQPGGDAAVRHSSALAAASSGEPDAGLIAQLAADPDLLLKFHASFVLSDWCEHPGKWAGKEFAKALIDNAMARVRLKDDGQGGDADDLINRILYGGGTPPVQGNLLNPADDFDEEAIGAIRVGITDRGRAAIAGDVLDDEPAIEEPFALDGGDDTAGVSA